MYLSPFPYSGKNDDSYAHDVDLKLSLDAKLGEGEIWSVSGEASDTDYSYNPSSTDPTDSYKPGEYSTGVSGNVGPVNGGVDRTVDQSGNVSYDDPASISVGESLSLSASVNWAWK